MSHINYVLLLVVLFEHNVSARNKHFYILLLSCSSILPEMIGL